MITCNVIRKVSGNYKVIYTGAKSEVIGTDTTPRDEIEVTPVKVKRTGRKLSTSCKHPPVRLYSWFANNTLCVVCMDCQTVLTGGAK